jgi:hypothetical protein
MSWHFSQALEAVYLAANSSAGQPCAPSRSMSMPAESCSPDKMTDASNPSPSGMTSAPSTADRGVEWWTSSLAVSRARTSLARAKEPESRASEADYGKKWGESLVRFDHDSCSWKTHQFSLLGGLESFSETWPRWGMMRSGECWVRPIPAHLIEERESGSSVVFPTPDTGLTPNGHGARGGKPGNGHQSGLSLPAMAKHAAWPEKFPTPNCYDAIPDYGNRKDNNLEEGGRHGVSLRHLVKMWPTPTVDDSNNVTRQSGQFQSLTRSVQQWPTPKAEDWKNRGAPDSPCVQRRIAMGKQVDLCHSVGGSLNPTWVEWLMGWPLGWTDCDASATDKFRQWCASHGKL